MCWNPTAPTRTVVLSFQHPSHRLFGVGGDLKRRWLGANAPTCPNRMPPAPARHISGTHLDFLASAPMRRSKSASLFSRLSFSFCSRAYSLLSPSACFLSASAPRSAESRAPSASASRFSRRVTASSLIAAPPSSSFFPSAALGAPAALAALAALGRRIGTRNASSSPAPSLPARPALPPGTGLRVFRLEARLGCPVSAACLKKAAARSFCSPSAGQCGSSWSSTRRIVGSHARESCCAEVPSPCRGGASPSSTRSVASQHSDVSVAL
mmetsp:Transcript_24622/g.49951  ORF Transcript_24622/g.49951 Transcript_24622/m.49951 type:complete len:268 (+) Transcript_24622:117-920(+)